MDPVTIKMHLVFLNGAQTASLAMSSFVTTHVVFAFTDLDSIRHCQMSIHVSCFVHLLVTTQGPDDYLSLLIVVFRACPQGTCFANVFRLNIVNTDESMTYRADSNSW
jgi:hypothetical protein